MKMNQRLINKVKGLVDELGLIGALNILGGEKEIIRQAYIDNPESYLDYLIDNLIPTDGNGYVKKTWIYNLKKNIFIVYDDTEGVVTVDDFIWNYFYGSILQFDKTKIESLFTKWFYKHIPELSEKKPIPYSDIDDIRRSWKHVGLLGGVDTGLLKSRNGPDYMVVPSSMVDYLKTINVGK